MIPKHHKGGIIMHKRLFTHEPICNLDGALHVFPLALIASARLIGFTYPRIMHSLQRGAQIAFISLLWGVQFLDRHYNYPHTHQLREISRCFCQELAFLHPHPSLPPSRGKESKRLS